VLDVQVYVDCVALQPLEAAVNAQRAWAREEGGATRQKRAVKSRLWSLNEEALLRLAIELDQAQLQIETQQLLTLLDPGRDSLQTAQRAAYDAQAEPHDLPAASAPVRCPCAPPPSCAFPRNSAQ
jgi:hypothetical protein